MFPAFSTLARAVEIEGVALHCGRQITLRLQPSEHLGVRFVRVDLPGAPGVEADIARISATTHATVLEAGQARVSTVEHLLAAIWARGLTHVRVELDGPEVPILDGSSQGWVELLEGAGRAELSGRCPVARLQSPVWLQKGDAQMLGLPLPSAIEPTFRLSVGADFGVVPAQVFDGEITADSFSRDLAPARTFTLDSWLEPLRAQGLIQGGSLDNAVVFFEGAPSSPLRFPDELARHKALDCIGDLALALCPRGARFHGHLVALRAGHGVHRQWALQALESGALGFV